MATVKKIASEMNWEYQKNAAYGEYNGFSISLIQNISYGNSQNNFKLLYVTYNRLSTGSVAVLNSFVEAHKKELRFFKYDINEGLLSARLNEGFKPLNVERLQELLTTLQQGLSEAGATPKNTCAYCEQEADGSVTYINQIKLPAHDACRQEAIEKNQEMKKAMQSQPSSPMGYVGAVAGAILGAIPFAIGVWFGWYVGILTVLTGFISYEGFKFLGGKADKFTKYLIAVVSLGAILLSNYALMGVVAVQNNVAVSDVLAVQEIKAIFTEMLGMSALFGLLGVIAIFSRIKRDEFSTDIR